MTKTLLVYDTDTGRITSRMSCSGDANAPDLVLPDGRVAIEAQGHPKTHYIHDGVPVPFPEKPGSWARWDWSAKAWVDPRTEADHAAALAAAWAALRVERDRRLAATDKYMRPDYPISDEGRVAVIAYSAALRHLPDVTTNPAAPVWPDPPNP